MPVGGFALFEADEDVFGVVNVELVENVVFCPSCVSILTSHFPATNRTSERHKKQDSPVPTPTIHVPPRASTKNPPPNPGPDTLLPCAVAQEFSQYTDAVSVKCAHNRAVPPTIKK